MVFLSSRFLHLFLVLFALGSFDGAPWLGRSSTSHSHSGPGVAAAPTGSVAARIGIVVKDDVDGDSTAASSLAPSRRGSAFEDFDMANGHNPDAYNVPLERIDARDEGNVHPFMLFQQHLNRANVKMAQMQKREPPTAAELAQAILNRRRSIEDAYGGRGRRRSSEDINARDAKGSAGVFKSSTSRLPSTHGRIGVVLRPETVAEDDAESSTQNETAEKRLFQGVYNALSDAFSSNEAANLKSASSKTSKDITSAKKKASQLAYADTLSAAAPVTAANSLGLAIEANNIGYVATIEMGSKKTPFRMLIDSGSADTWVPSSKCSSCGSKQQRLSKSVSSTLQTSKTPWSITYGTGNARGVLATDDISVAGMSVKNYKFALATYESDDFSSSPFDGLMGLAKQELANSNSPTPIDALFNAKLVKAPVMGYKLGDATATKQTSPSKQQDGQVTFGGVDSSKFTGALVEIPNVSSQGFYEIPIQGVSINGKAIAKLGSGRTSILDTGTSLMVAPQADAEAVHAQIPGATSDGQGGFTVPCNTTAQLSFKFGGVEWPLLARDLIFVPLDDSNPNGDCVSSLGGGDVGQNGEWLVGAAALKRLYFATNASKNVIGLGKLSNPVS